MYIKSKKVKVSKTSTSHLQVLVPNLTLSEAPVGAYQLSHQAQDQEFPHDRKNDTDFLYTHNSSRKIN